MARLQTIIPVIVTSIITACQLHAADIDTGADKSPDEKCTASKAPESETKKCDTRLRPELTEQEQRQMKQMQAVLYDMREDTWDDRYRY